MSSSSGRTWMFALVLSVVALAFALVGAVLLFGGMGPGTYETLTQVPHYRWTPGDHVKFIAAPLAWLLAIVFADRAGVRWSAVIAQRRMESFRGIEGASEVTTEPTRSDGG